MTPLRIGCVVEGDGEVGAVPILIRRIAAQFDPTLSVEIPTPVKVKRNRVKEEFGDLERAVKLAVANVRAKGGLLILLDSEGECPAKLGPDLLARASGARPDLPVAVVLAHQEFESWFLASAETMRGKRDLASDLQPSADPEAIPGAKEWLRRHMPPNRKYSERADQPALTSFLDFAVARARAASFDKCLREVERLLGLLRPAPPPPSVPDTTTPPSA